MTLSVPENKFYYMLNLTPAERHLSLISKISGSSLGVSPSLGQLRTAFCHTPRLRCHENEEMWFGWENWRRSTNRAIFVCSCYQWELSICSDSISLMSPRPTASAEVCKLPFLYLCVLKSEWHNFMLLKMAPVRIWWSLRPERTISTCIV